MKSYDDRKIVTFEETGLGTIQDDVERTALRHGDKILIKRIRLRNSPKRNVRGIGWVGKNDIEIRATTSAMIIDSYRV